MGRRAAANRVARKSKADPQDPAAGRRGAGAAEALRRTQERLSVALESSRAVTWVWNIGDDRIDWMPDVGTVYGVLPDALRTFDAWLMRVEAEDRERVVAHLRRLVENRDEDVWDEEFRIAHPQRGERWIGALGRAYRDASGRAVRMAGVNFDITERKQAERALEEQARLLDLSHDAIIIRDAGDRITYWNRGAEEIYGYRRAEALGRGVHELLRTEFPVPLDNIRDSLARDGRWAGELTQTTKRGARIATLSRWMLDRDAAGRAAQVLETNNDLTEYRAAEIAVRTSEARFRAIYDNAVVGIAIADRSGQFERCNQAYSNLIGYTERELREIRFGSLVHPEDRAANLAENQRLLGGEIPYFEIENRYLRKDGSSIWVHKFVSMLPGPADQPSHMLAVVSDITARKEAEIGLQASETRVRRLNALLAQRVVRRTAQLDEQHARLQAVVDTAAEGIVTVDVEGSIESVNAAALRLFGYAGDDLLGRDIGVLLPQWKREVQARWPSEDAHAAPASTVLALVGRDRAGNEIPLEVSVGAIPLSGTRLFVVLLRDVSLQRRLEAQVRERLEDAAQLHRLRTAGELAGVLAHQLNQPLAAILSFAEAAAARLRRGNSTPERVSTALAEIIDQAQRAAESIRDLRGFLSRERSERTAEDLEPIVRQALDLMTVLANDAGIAIRHHGLKSLPPVMMHRSQIEQVLLILLDNALDAILDRQGAEAAARRPRGTIDVSGGLDVEGRGVRITVLDSGPGLDEDLAKRVFDPLYTTKMNGIGLGLSIARSIIEDHGGRIWAEPGQGGRFHFYLPFAP